MFNLNIFANPKAPDTGGWRTRHNDAVSNPGRLEHPIIYAALAIGNYSKNYAINYGANVAEDAILGQEAILPMIRAFRTLLNGELGRLDAGTLDAWILAVAKEAGFTEEDL